MRGWLAGKVLESDGTAGGRFVEVDLREVAVLARLDSVEVYHGRKRIIAFSMSPRMAWRLGRFLVWWWASRCWFGLRVRLWRWALERRVRGDGGEPKRAG